MAEEATIEKPVKRPARSGMSVKVMIVVAVAVLLVGIAGAVVALKFLKGEEDGGQSGPVASQADPSGGPDAGQQPIERGDPGVIVDLDPFIVNLADYPELRYLKVTVKLEVGKVEESENIQTRVAPIRDTVLVLLSSKNSDSLRSAQGKLQLREEIIQRINTVLPAPTIRNAYFTEFVVQ